MVSSLNASSWKQAGNGKRGQTMLIVSALNVNVWKEERKKRRRDKIFQWFLL
jgi:hypothetical protein